MAGRIRMTNALEIARQLAQNTPPERNRVVDLLRVTSIVIVVIGHWLLAAVLIEDGAIAVDHVLSELSWARSLTWLLQVMPIFFFVGG